MLPFSTAAAAAGGGGSGGGGGGDGENDDGEVDCVSGIERSSTVGKLLLESETNFGFRGAAIGGGCFLTTKQNTTITRQEIYNL